MLGSLIDERRDRDYHCTIYRRGEPPDIERWLADRGIVTEARLLPPHGPDPFIEITVDEEVVGIIGIEAIEGLTEPPIIRPGEDNKWSAGYRALFELLDKTVISGMNRRELLAVSREIEDRAFRTGSGTLRASFQTFSTFESQTAVYRTLAAETALDIHLYGVEDWTPPAISGITYHADDAKRLEPYWALAYDGGPDRTQACGLVAEELSDGYTGFWTSDAAVVEEIATRLDEAK